ncbi:MAG: hypothetical protein IKO49_00195 [Bacilli bacterium]|nr:hypothetical protein [Bacilli bacterium]
MNQENNNNSNINNNNAVNQNNGKSQNTINNVIPPVSSTLPKPQVVNTSVNQVKENVVPNPVVVEKQNNQEPPKKEGVFKYILVFIFLIGIVLFVFFLPQISEIIKEKQKNSNKSTSSDLIDNGTLICEKKHSTDETDIYYDFSFLFNDRKLETSTLETRIESINTDYLTKRKEECDLISSISDSISGVSVSCDFSSGVLKIKEEYTHKSISTDNLTAYTEAGGTYPEFEYHKNIYDIKSSLLKDGYDCDVTSVQE